MQILLAILVALVQVAGPWLCCCGSVRWFARANDARMCHTSPVPSTPPACPHCKTAESHTPAEPQTPPTKPAPDSCPCGGVELLAVADDRSQSASAMAELLLPAERLVGMVFVLPVLSQSVATLPGLRELPILTTAERLFAHHVLRC